MNKFSMHHISMLLFILVATSALVILELNDLSKEYINQVILGLLIAFSLFFVERNNEQKNSIDKLETDISNIKNKLENSTSLEIIQSSENLFKNINKLIHQDSNVVATSFSERKLEEDIIGKEVENYLMKLENYLKDDKNSFKLRRLTNTKSLKKLDWIKKTIERCDDSHKYFLSIQSENDFTPLPNLIIIDKKYTFIFGEHFSCVDPKYLFFDNEEISRYFLELFDLAWRKSIPIKEGKNTNWDAFSIIEEELKK